MSKYHDTEGEKIVEFFLQDEGLKFKKQVEIAKLQGDFADYRIADFYLPQYRVYVEFLGKWNSSEGKSKYLQKMDIYKKNGIPCVYIYPDNLGTLKYLFYMRLRDELEKHPKLKFQLFRYKCARTLKAVGNIWVFFLGAALLVIFGSSNIQLNPEAVPYTLLIIGLLLILSLGLTFSAVKNIFGRK
ncbi:MAG: hypothetical protein R3B71_02175 [Candidatus Gracilibacteria bacterium]